MRRWLSLKVLGGLIQGMVSGFLGISIGWFFGGFIGAAICLGIMLLIPYGVALIKGRNIFSKNNINNVELHSPTTPIPQDLQGFHDELISLGFTLVGESWHEISSSHYKQWLYFNEDHTVLAYIYNIPNTQMPLVGFSCYFKDGFDVSTRHPDGDVIESDKLIYHVVKTSLIAAFDYHMHHTQEQSLAHGELVAFANLEQVLEWERKQEYAKAMYGNFKSHIWSLAWRSVMAIISVLIIITLLIPITVYIYQYFVSSDDYLMLYILDMGMGSVIVSIAFYVALSPILKSKTVESRKKRKKKEDEGIGETQGTQEEIYPF